MLRRLNDSDLDFGSGGVMLIPTMSGQTAPPIAFAVGKSAILYLIDKDKLGGFDSSDPSVSQAPHLGNYGGGI